MTDHNKTPFFSGGTTLLLLLVGLFVATAILRLISGLGPTTHLTDDVPWGLWVGIDILCGVALAAGGFTIAGAVYIFNMKRYKPIARPAVLTAFIGYVIVAVGVFFDVGKSFDLWHPLVMWQYHSIMFEVVWCVVFYTTVLALEFAPNLLEGLGKTGAANAMRSKAVVFPLVIAAITLSFLHQSSLGALFLLVPAKLNHLWWTTMLPYNFFLSAIAVGLAMVSFETIVAGKIFRHDVGTDITKGLARGSAIALLVYLAARLGDIVLKGKTGLITAGGTESTLFLVEIVAGVVLPMIILFVAGTSKSDSVAGIFFADILIIGGIVFNRLNILFLTQGGWQTGYFPSWKEFAITIGLVSLILVLYRLAVIYLPIMTHTETAAE